MHIYDIGEALEALIDPETGEIQDFEKFEKLYTKREQAIEALCLSYKDLCGDAEKIKAEKKILDGRIKSLEKNAQHIKDYVQFLLKGQPFQTARVVVSFRASEGTVVDDDFLAWAEENADDLLTYKEPTPNLTAIKKAIQAKRPVEHAFIEQRLNMNIK